MTESGEAAAERRAHQSERRRLFGTDGLRGVANDDLSVEVVVGVGRAAATVLGWGHTRPRFLVGGDTRASTELLTAALVAGLTSAGADVSLLGVIPTPGVAWAATVAGGAAGAVISASHNPAPDNGVKFFGPDGRKLPDAVEASIEACYFEAAWNRPTGGAVGRVVGAEHLTAGYVNHLVGSSPRLDGLRVVLDCAHGAAVVSGPEALRRAGAEVEVICAEPDGLNINAGCGATDLGVLAHEVVVSGADLGLAVDGDADRLMAVDHQGSVVDGDQVLAICALDRQRRGALRGGAVVTTVMANLGFHRAMAAAGVVVHETPVGDRYVLEALLREGIEVGGEQSGHTLFLDLSTTGDGILTGLQLCGVLAGTGRKLADLAAVVERYPQVLINVAVADKVAAVAAPPVQAALAEAQARLGEEGRVLLRPSGTEQKVRVMVEAHEETVAREVAEAIASVVVAASN